MHRAKTVCAGIATADDDHVLAGRRDRFTLAHLVALTAAILLRQVLHRIVDALERATWHGQIARLARAAREEHRIEVALQIARGDLDTDVGACAEDHPLR